MKIEYLGHSSFLLSSGGGTKVITDPYGDVGLCFPHVKADGVTVSHFHYDHCNVKAVKGNPIVFDREGEFTLKEIKLFSIPCFHDTVSGAQRGKNLIFFFEIDGLRLCHMGDIGECCTEKLCSIFPPIDILFIPVGGNYTIDSSQAKKFVDRLQPKIVIPMHYEVEGLTIDLNPPENFLSMFDHVKTVENSFNLSKENIPVKTEVLFFKRGK